LGAAGVAILATMSPAQARAIALSNSDRYAEFHTSMSALLLAPDPRIGKQSAQKGIFDVVLHHALVSQIDFRRRDQFDIGNNVVPGTEIEHLLCLRQATDAGALDF
jgi:hypothetical protein